VNVRYEPAKRRYTAPSARIGSWRRAEARPCATEIAPALRLPLSADECELVSGRVESREIPEGKIPGAEGDAGYFFFVIEKGTATVSRDGRVLNELGSGDFFGEIASSEGVGERRPWPPRRQ
jgi:CRP-like cAMP-binding protein